MKQRENEIAWTNQDRQPTESRSVQTEETATLMQTDADVTAPVNSHRPLVSSTPYHGPSPLNPATTASFISPVRNQQEGTNGSPSKKADSNPAASESEAWSEPDRTVSLARMGLVAGKAAGAVPAIPALLTDGYDVSSDASVDPGYVNNNNNNGVTGMRKRTASNRMRTLEQDNSSLRAQLAELVDTLKSTWNEQQSKSVDESRDVKQDTMDTFSETAKVFSISTSSLFD